MTITSEDELRREILNRLRQATDYILNIIWNENRTLIERIVYEAEGQGYIGEGTSAYTPNPTITAQYERTGEFKNAWRTEVSTSVSGNNVSGRFAYDPSLITGRPPNQHVSVLEGHQPIMSYLADIIYEGTAGKIFGEGYWTKPRNAYKELDKWLTNTEFRKIFEEGMTRAGLPWRKSNGPVVKENFNK